MKDWNTFYRNVVLLVFLALASNLFGQTEKAGKKIIVIDPGHGGIDSGAVGINGIKEKDVVLNIALEIIRLNELKPYNNLDIYLTRYKDTLISLSDRTKLSKALHTDIFFSLHCNHSDNPKARGIEVFVSNSIGKYFKHSILMGHEIEKALVHNIGLESRGVKFANFQVLRETVDYFPSVLLEFGFLSNMDEASYFSVDKNLKGFALLLLNELYKIKSYE
ncbi:N-acetylmuramoyl-L-alanine amidase [Subsaxibacter sp. CAU 1640]|uniref:N-acetylmuramoyl-L-alanine amidase family protein n=1 Tax=Subsaxibacter sp. CAU 1640 TaxID=2933271 RepID=UPI002003BE35|nr:N-acetylmuramoyl-L-alanine amidase [Subsaxibacter sp. CAU 1640]MCK7591337.1 N-acetylmuramoyl-L-alanine amidase [Subsaxibacter sp. CAU 1640]